MEHACLGRSPDCRFRRRGRAETGGARPARDNRASSRKVSLLKTCMTLFREEYGHHLLDQTCLYPSAKEALDRLSWASFAVVTNKPEGFSRRILDGLGVGNRFCAILGGDSVQKRKPDPEALLKAMNACRAAPSETAMVGDSPVDIQAGKAAGVTTCGVLGGFRPRQELEGGRMRSDH